MKMNLVVIALLVLSLTLFGCSTSGTKTSNVNGNWTASLTDTHGSGARFQHHDYGKLEQLA